HIRDIRTCPTRRSSDLARCCAIEHGEEAAVRTQDREDVREVTGASDTTTPCRRGTRQEQRGRGREEEPGAPDAGHAAFARLARADRKSTRLNSSHVKIS